MLVKSAQHSLIVFWVFVFSTSEDSNPVKKQASACNIIERNFQTLVYEKSANIPLYIEGPHQLKYLRVLPVAFI